MCAINYCIPHGHEHASLIGDHNIIQIRKRKRIPNPIIKKQLIERIIQVKNDTDSQIVDLMKRQQKLMQDLKNQFNSIISQARQFVNLCKDVINQISGIIEFEEKEFFNPLEKALLSSNIDDFLKEIHSPILEFSETNTRFNYIPSNFPHFLYNYSDYSIEDSKDNSIKIISSNNNDEKCWNLAFSRFLNVGNNKIFCTGDCNNQSRRTYVLDLVSKKIEEYPNLLNSITLHSMTWINGFVAVIGGFNENNSINNVEIFTEKKWIHADSINIPRCGHTSIHYKKSTFVIGGYNQNGGNIHCNPPRNI